MAPKITVDETLRFMYICLKHKTSENIDFSGVSGEYENLKPGAARMRYYRLREAIEGRKAGEDANTDNREPGKASVKSTPSKHSNRASGGAKGKKRKLDEDAAATDDEEALNKHVKTESDEFEPA